MQPLVLKLRLWLQHTLNDTELDMLVGPKKAFYIDSERGYEFRMLTLHPGTHSLSILPGSPLFIVRHSGQ